jgi:hypothetical protein
MKRTTARRPAAKPRASHQTARPAAARQTSAKQVAGKQTTPAAAKRVSKSRAPAKHRPRADRGAPIDGFFARQPAALRPILVGLRELVEETAPDAEAAIKWGIPFFSINGATMCGLGGHKAHVNLILPGPPGTYPDPAGLLSGDGKTGRHLRLTATDEIPRAAVRGWLRTAAARARKG